MIKLIDVNKTYKTKIGKDVHALKKFSYTFPNTGFFQLKGHSGSGKTTLLGMLGGLLKPDSGNIFFGNDDIVAYSQKQLDTFRADAISFVFQQYCLFEELSVLENVKLVCPNSVGDDKAIECLKLVGLEGYEKRRISELSGGQKQRVSIARALAKDAKVILADEPTGALDKENSINLFSLLKDLSKDRLIIFSSHETEILKPFKPIVLNLEDGELKNKPKAFKEITSFKQKDKKEPLSIKRIFHFGVSLFKKYGFRSSFASILLALTSALSIFGFSFNQYDTTRSVQSMMVETGENSLAFVKRLKNNDTIYASYTIDEINELKKNEDFVVLPCLNNILTSPLKFSLLPNDINNIEKVDYRFGSFSNFCRYDSYVEKHYPLLCGSKPMKSTDVLISETSFNMFKKYGFGTTIRKDQITSMERFLDLNPKFTIGLVTYEVVGIIDCGKYDTHDTYPDFSAKLSGESTSYDYGYSLSNPKNLLHVSPDAYPIKSNVTVLNSPTRLEIDGEEQEIGSLSILDESNFVEVDSSNPYGISMYYLSKLLPTSYTLPNSSCYKDFSKVIRFDFKTYEDWNTGFSSYKSFGNDIPLNMLFSKSNAFIPYLSYLACGEYISQNGLPTGDELTLLKERATEFFNKRFKEENELDFYSSDEKTQDILKNFYFVLMLSTTLYVNDWDTSETIEGFYSKERVDKITNDFIDKIKNDLKSALSSIVFSMTKFSDGTKIKQRDIKIGYLNFESNIYKSFGNSNGAYMLYAKENQYNEIINDYNQTTNFENIIISRLNVDSKINSAINAVEGIDKSGRFAFSRINGATFFMSTKKDYITTASGFSLLFAAILVVISALLLFFFLISVEKNEEKNLSLIRCFGYDKFKSIIPLATIPLIACFVAFIFSIIFVIIINIFGNSYLASLFGINASFIFINPLMLFIALGCSLLISALCLIIPIVRFRKRDLLSSLN